MNIVIHAADPWTFGWDALVAIGTLALAGGTVALAGMTYFVARETRSVAKATLQEVQADWRPVLLVNEMEISSSGHQTPGISLSPEGVRIGVTNRGRGPALDVNAELWFTHELRRAEPQRVALAPGESAQFYWDADIGEDFQTEDITQLGWLMYSDLSYEGYQTSFAIKSGSPGMGWLDWQRVDANPTYRPPLYGP